MRSSHSGIVARGVGKRFGGAVALPATDFTAPAGAVSLLVGRNGSGKTTLLRVLATLVRPDEGVAHINGIDVARDGRAVREQLGLALVNERAVFWRLSVLENVELFAKARGVPRRERRQRCRAVIEELGLGVLEHRETQSLSAGQRQRLILGRALVGDPAVLLIDEPLRGLDAEAEVLAINALQARAANGATVVVATPSLREYEALGGAPVTKVGARVHP